jgi:RNA polymerase sigma factor (sigma-70 family)
MIGDRILVWRFNRGEPAALCRIYEKYRDDLLRVAAALLNDRRVIEDVLHDVFVGFAQSAGQFELQGSLKGYLAICVANRTRDRNRRTQGRSWAQLDATTPLSAGDEGPDQAAMSRELAGKLDSLMSQLPEDQREIIVLHLQSKLPFREIADLQQIPINTALSRYRYGLDELRAGLDGKLDHD